MWFASSRVRGLLTGNYGVTVYPSGEDDFRRNEKKMLTNRRTDVSRVAQTCAYQRVCDLLLRVLRQTHYHELTLRFFHRFCCLQDAAVLAIDRFPF